MKKLRYVILFLSLFLITTIFSLLINGQFFPEANIENIWFYTGIIMVLFSMFFIEPYYTAPKNVITNSSAIVLVLLSIKSSLPESIILSKLWWAAFIYSLLMLMIALITIIIADEKRSPENAQNKIADICKIISVNFGTGKIQFSIIFLIFLLFYHNIQDIKILSLMIFWWLIIVLDPPRLINKIEKNNKRCKLAIGEIFGVQSKKIFLVKLYTDKPYAIRKFDIVEFNYSMEDYSSLIRGIVFDNYLLNQEKWIKVLQLNVLTDTLQLKFE